MNLLYIRYIVSLTLLRIAVIEGVSLDSINKASERIQSIIDEVGFISIWFYNGIKQRHSAKDVMFISFSDLL